MAGILISVRPMLAKVIGRTETREPADTASPKLSDFVGVSEQPYSSMELPNLHVMVIDILERVFERSRIIR